MLAYNNPDKISSRDLIVKVIKEQLPGQKIRMFELLGGGVGAKHYDANLPMEHMTLVEQKTELVNAFDEETLKNFALKYHTSAHKFFKHFEQKSIKDYNQHYSKHFFNVINLDFCSWWHVSDSERSTALIVDKMFSSKALAPGGLLFATFQVEGFNLDRWKISTGKDVPTDIDKIALELANTATKHGYSLKKVFENKYKSGSRRGQHMVNIGLKAA